MAKSKGKTANIFVWIILGLLIIGLAGFGVDGFGGSVNRIGSVGEREISVDDYARAMQQERRALQSERGETVSLEQMRAMGLDQQVLRRLVTTAALENEAMRLGISVGDERVAEEIQAISAFQGVDGQFDREAYRFALDQRGMNRADFEDDIRMETARGLLQTAVLGAASAPDTYVETLMNYIGERRSFRMVTLGQDDLAEPVPTPSRAELRSHYDDNIDAYTRPEAKRITYAWITPSMIVDTVEVDEQALREAYEERISEFRQPERRLVERLVFPTREAAQAARERIESGEVGFAEVVEERGLELADTDLGDVTRDDLGAAGDAVFALDSPGIAGPVQTDLGPALFRMNAILAAQETTFEEARGQLREELARDRARRVIDQSIDGYRDTLAAGGRLEELAEETEMELDRIDYTSETRSGIAGYPAFREAARSVTQDDFPEIRTLDDGGVFALRLDETLEPEPRPFDDVMVQVIEDWEREEMLDRLAARAGEARDALSEGTELADLDLLPETFEGLTRDAFIEGAPGGLMQTVFEMTPQEARVIRGGETVHLIILDEILEPARESESFTQAREQISQRAAQSLSQDLFTLYAQALESRAGISLDQSAINAVQSQLQ